VLLNILTELLVCRHVLLHPAQHSGAVTVRNRTSRRLTILGTLGLVSGSKVGGFMRLSLAVILVFVLVAAVLPISTPLLLWSKILTALGESALSYPV